MSSTIYTIPGYRNESFRQDKEAKQHKSICLNHGLLLTEIKLGFGSYSTVRLGVKISPNINSQGQSKKVAIKIVSKTKAFQEGNKGFLVNEIFNHRIASTHRNVVTLFDVFETNSHLYLVLEYCPNGNLLDFINKHGKPGLCESQSRLIFSQLCHAVTFCHENNIVHRDIKCENVLLDERLAVRLTDFGFSCMVTDNQKDLGMFCGSLAYAAPEIIRGRPYNGKWADIWSLGIVLYCLVCGRLPFNLKNKTLLLQDMQYQRICLTSLSSELVLLLRQMLQYDAERRPSLKPILENSWTQGRRIHPGTSLHQSEILNKRFSYRMKGRSAVVRGDATCTERIILRSRLPTKQSKARGYMPPLQEQVAERHHGCEEDRGPHFDDDTDASLDSIGKGRLHQNSPEDDMSNGENEQGDHQRETDMKPPYCQCCVICYRDRVKQCLISLEKHFKKFPNCDNFSAAELLREQWNQETSFGLMSLEQAMLILIAWRQQLSKEKARPVLRLTKKNKIGMVPPKAKGQIVLPSSGMSVHSEETNYTTSTKVTYQSEKFPLDDLLLIKKVFGNGLGVPCSKKPQDSVKVSLVANSMTSVPQTIAGRSSMNSPYTTKWEIMLPKQIKQPSIPSLFSQRGNNHKKVAIMPSVKPLLNKGITASDKFQSTYSTSLTSRYEKSLKYSAKPRTGMTTKDLISALGTSYPRKSKTIDICIRPWKP